MLLDAVMIIQSCLSTPANVEGGMDMGLAPLHDLAEFLPVVHIFKFHQFHRRTGDHHTVKFPILQFLKALVEGQQMLLSHIFGLVGLFLLLLAWKKDFE